MAKKKVDEPTGVEDTGHEWDGIKELNNPLPRWWLWTFYVTIVWGVGYTIAYPAWPMISGATTGLMGFSTRGNVAQDIIEHEAQNSALVAQLLDAELASVQPGDDLHRYAVSRGGAVFRAQCSQCHGSGAAGATGYPNLRDNAWLWGGEVEEIAYTVQHGIRNDTDPDARWSQMPAFDEILTDEEIAALVGHVQSLSTDVEGSSMGAELFADNCAACHGEMGEGNHDLGAPTLSDQIWLYGGDTDTITTTIRYSRFGQMPAWGQRLSDADVAAVSLYVHNLGGGE